MFSACDSFHSHFHLSRRGKGDQGRRLETDRRDWRLAQGQGLARVGRQSFVFANRRRSWWPATGNKRQGNLPQQRQLAATNSLHAPQDLWFILQGKSARPLTYGSTVFSPACKHRAQPPSSLSLPTLLLLASLSSPPNTHLFHLLLSLPSTFHHSSATHLSILRQTFITQQPALLLLRSFNT